MAHHLSLWTGRTFLRRHFLTPHHHNHKIKQPRESFKKEIHGANQYPETGSNRHGLLHWCLRPARLPIPPSGQMTSFSKTLCKVSAFYLMPQILVIKVVSILYMPITDGLSCWKQRLTHIVLMKWKSRGKELSFRRLAENVGMTRLELATTRPPDAYATNCATSRFRTAKVKKRRELYKLSGLFFFKNILFTFIRTLSELYSTFIYYICLWIKKTGLKDEISAKLRLKDSDDKS